MIGFTYLKNRFLTDIKDISGSDGDFLVNNGSAWTNESGATARTSMGVGTTDSPTFAACSIGTGELTCGAINRATGTLTLEIGGTAELSITSTATTFGGNIAVPTGSRLSWLSDNARIGFSDLSGYGTTMCLTMDGIGVDNLLFMRNFSAGGENSIRWYKSRNTSLNGHTAVVTGDAIGSFLALGSDGSAFRNVGQIYIDCEGTIGANQVPGRMRFLLSNASGTVTEVMRLSSGGSCYLTEIAAADTDIAGKGQLWVKNTTPCELWFTDDAGTDTQIV